MNSVAGNMDDGVARTKARRNRAVLLSVVTGGAIATSALMVNLLAERYPVRVDVTATGQQKLSPRSLQLLRSLNGPTQLVVATNLTAADARAKRNLTDTLDELQAAQPLFSRTMIDTGTPDGVKQFQSLVASLMSRDKSVIDANLATINEAKRVALVAAGSLKDRISKGLEEAATATPNRSQADIALRGYLQQIASLCRVRSDELNESIARVQELVDVKDGVVPATDQAGAMLVAKLRGVSDDIGAIRGELRSKTQSDATPPEMRSAIAPITTQLETMREDLERQFSPLATMPKPDILRVSRALSAGEGALLIGESSEGSTLGTQLVALDLGQLLPAGAWIDHAEVAKRDLRGRTEELLSTGIASLLSPQRPVVILMTPDKRQYLGADPYFVTLDQHLATKGIDFIEWQLQKATAPDFQAVDPQRLRPRVYITLAPEPIEGSGNESGVEFARRQAAAVAKLLDDGESVLINLNPSLAPVTGGKDPMNELLKPLGIDANTGTPLFQAVNTPNGTAVDSSRVVLAPNSDSNDQHIIAQATGSLPTYVTWAIPMTLTPPAKPLLVSKPEDSWAETQWGTLRKYTREQLAFAADRPKFDEGRDKKSPAGTDWIIAGASERTVGGRLQRVIAVGSNSWFADAITQQTVTVEGRPVVQYPGNMELFDASVAWLARQDEQIAQSPGARSVAMVKPMEAGTLRLVRTALIAGPAGLVALLGMLVWLVRR